jgi:molybdopterin converting factor small subunit
VSDQLPRGDVNENDVTLSVTVPVTVPVTVHYWAAARAAAGIAEEHVVAATLAELLAEISRRHGDRDRFDDVIGICSILVGDTPVGAKDPAEVALAPGVSVEFLPPFAGG